VKLLRSEDEYRKWARGEMEKAMDIIIASIKQEKEGSKGKQSVFIPPNLLEKVQ
jgi:hypothetical protein